MSTAGTHAQWSSRIGFVLAATGSAVGLGNIWKFPYMVGQSGGAAFVLVYLACILAIGLPILVAEWMLGRRGQRNPVNTMLLLSRANRRSSAWAVVGVGGVLAAFLILAFYSVIGGWALAYVGEAAAGHFAGLAGDDSRAAFDTLLGSAGTLLGWHTAFMLLTAGIVALGVTRGIEATARLLMPALAVLLLVLIAHGASTDGFAPTVSYLFRPDWSRLDIDVVLAAMGHAFFTLSLGMGIMMAYGSYLGQDVNLLSTARSVIALDTLFAIGAGFVIFPIVFSHGLAADSGPGLLFITLPVGFGAMDGGALIGTAFFVLLSFAALTSAISLIEPVVEFVEERSPLGRVAATWAVGLATWLLGIAALLSFNLWQDLQLAGLNMFDLLDHVTSTFLLPLTGFGAVLFAGWCLDRESVRAELGLTHGTFRAWEVLTRYVTPAGVLAIFLASL